MTRQEFIERVLVEVSAEEYESIEEVYMACDVMKDQFCHLWKAMNYARVMEAEKKLKEQRERGIIEDTLFNILYHIQAVIIDDSSKLSLSACDILRKREISALEKSGITADGARLLDVQYEITNYLKLTQK